MKCPKCGNELRVNPKNPDYGLCDNCRKKFLLDDYKLDYLYEAQQKKDKIVRQNRGCAIFLIIFIAIIALIIAIAVVFGGDNEQTSESSSNINLDSYYDTLGQQKTALDDLISKYENGEESPDTSAERLSGLADGFQNTIDVLETAQDSEYQSALITLATDYKIIADRYSTYITTGDSSELEDAQNIMDVVPQHQEAVEAAK